MPWSDTRYPPSMRHLPGQTRRNAIEIANALLDDGMDECKAIRVEIAKAKEWAEVQLGPPASTTVPAEPPAVRRQLRL